MLEKCCCVIQKGIHSWLTLPRCLDGCCHAGHQRSLSCSLCLWSCCFPTLAQLWLLKCTGHVSLTFPSCCPSLPLPPNSFSQTDHLNQIWQRQELSMKVVQIWGEFNVKIPRGSLHGGTVTSQGVPAVPGAGELTLPTPNSSREPPALPERGKAFQA